MKTLHVKRYVTVFTQFQSFAKFTVVYDARAAMQCPGVTVVGFVVDDIVVRVFEA